jgi:release factor glutamine methyltransferase
MMTANLGDWLHVASQLLGTRSERPMAEAQWLAAHALGQQRAWVIAHPEVILDEEQQYCLNELLQRCVVGEPLPYVLGEWEFYGLRLRVSPAVLIPRPETELLVEDALSWLAKNPERRRAADVGTGSGCIAAALARCVQDLQLIAVDLSRAALRLASENFAVLGLERQVQLVQGDLLSAFVGPFDLVCANLPYIPRAMLAELAVARTEPILALDGGEDGLRLIEALLHDAPRWMSPGGLMLLEIEQGQGEAASALVRHYLGEQVEVKLVKDFAGLAREVWIQWRN